MGFAPRCAELRGFTAEIRQTVENDREILKQGLLTRMLRGQVLTGSRLKDMGTRTLRVQF